ncbi:uncharacterized protein VTP21DRAFT_3167 [Calcarisporiella thermophila]|uniref:uncharacterized protein n=1 Tax=Calcarisporiella thermophila TaxID=911321 RepID=UPI0037434982
MFSLHGKSAEGSVTLVHMNPPSAKVENSVRRACAAIGAQPLLIPLYRRIRFGSVHQATGRGRRLLRERLATSANGPPVWLVLHARAGTRSCLPFSSPDTAVPISGAQAVGAFSPNPSVEPIGPWWACYVRFIYGPILIKRGCGVLRPAGLSADRCLRNGTVRRCGKDLLQIATASGLYRDSPRSPPPPLAHSAGPRAFRPRPHPPDLKANFAFRGGDREVISKTPRLLNNNT